MSSAWWVGETAMLGMSAPGWSVYMRDDLQVDRPDGKTPSGEKLTPINFSTSVYLSAKSHFRDETESTTTEKSDNRTPSSSPRHADTAQGGVEQANQ
jgi:hypothetical protein